MMYEIDINPEALKRSFRVLGEIAKEIPFAASVGLNRTADEAQQAIRASLSQHFTLRRRAFVESTIYRMPREDFATKATLRAGVRIHPERDFLSKFEEGGVKKPRDGRTLGIPIEARPTKEQLVPPKYQLRTLFFGQRSTPSRVGTLLGARKGRGRNALVKAFEGTGAFVRNGRVFLREGKNKLKLLWVFRPRVPVPASLRFLATANQIASQRAEPNLMGAINHMIDGKWQSGKR